MRDLNGWAEWAIALGHQPAEQLPQHSLDALESAQAEVLRSLKIDSEVVGELPLPLEPHSHLSGAAWLPGGQLMLADEFRHCLYRIDLEAADVEVIGERGSQPGQFWYPRNPAWTAGKLWLCDSWNHRLQCWDPQQDSWRAFGQMGDGPGCWNEPHQLLSDQAGGLLVVDRCNHRLVQVDADGRSFRPLGQPDDSSSTRHDYPTHLTRTPDGMLLLLDRHGQRIQCWSMQGGGSTTAARVVLGPRVADFACRGPLLVVTEECRSELRLLTRMGTPLVTFSLPGAGEPLLLAPRPEDAENTLLLLQGRQLIRLNLPALSRTTTELAAALLPAFDDTQLIPLAAELAQDMPDEVIDLLRQRILQADLPLDEARQARLLCPGLIEGWQHEGRLADEEAGYTDQLIDALEQLELLTTRFRDSMFEVYAGAVLERPSQQLSRYCELENQLRGARQSLLEHSQGPASMLARLRFLVALDGDEAWTVVDGEGQVLQILTELNRLSQRLLDHQEWLIEHRQACPGGLPQSWPFEFRGMYFSEHQYHWKSARMPDVLGQLADHLEQAMLALSTVTVKRSIQLEHGQLLALEGLRLAWWSRRIFCELGAASSVGQTESLSQTARLWCEMGHYRTQIASCLKGASVEPETLAAMPGLEQVASIELTCQRPMSMLVLSDGYLLCDVSQYPADTTLIQLDREGAERASYSSKELGFPCCFNLWQVGEEVGGCSLEGSVFRLDTSSGKAAGLDLPAVTHAFNYDRDPDGNQLLLDCIQDEPGFAAHLVSAEGEHLAQLSDPDGVLAPWGTTFLSDGTVLMADYRARTIWRWAWRSSQLLVFHRGSAYCCSQPRRNPLDGSVWFADLGDLIQLDDEGMFQARHPISSGSAGVVYDLRFSEEQGTLRLHVLYLMPAMIKVYEITTPGQD